ncbi:MAG: cobalamin B12-binding domain-containing protein, partial [Candidatus Poribacteria bacterium]
PAEKFVDAVKQGAQIVAMSALLTTTMTAMKTTIDALREAGVRDQAKVLIGGAPVTQNFADEIGADGYARDAASGADKAKELLGK